MATEIGIVKALIGTAVITAADGSQRNLVVGDRVYADEIITTGDASAIEVEFSDGSLMALGRNSQALLDAEVFDPQHILTSDDEADVAALQAALVDGEDPTQEGEAPAAGPESDGGNEGVTTVVVEHLDPVVDVTSGFKTSGVSRNFLDDNNLFDEDSNDASSNIEDSPLPPPINPINDPTITVPDTGNTNEDITLTGNVLTNDSDSDDVLEIVTFTIAGDTYTAGGSPVMIAGVGTLAITSTGDYTFVPAPNYSGAAPVTTYTTNTGSSDALTLDVAPVADAPTLIMSVAEPVVLDAPIQTIDINNVATTGNGFTVSAAGLDGGPADISIRTNPRNAGFGVQGNASGASSELGSTSTASEELNVMFDGVVSSIDVSFSWMHARETAQYDFYLNGVHVGSGATNGITDRIDGPFTLTPGTEFDQVVFSAPLNPADDYLINSITFDLAASYTYDINISAALTDVDGSEALSGITIANLPAGTSITTTANGDGTYNSGTVTLVSDHELTSTEINAITGSVTATDGVSTATTNSNVKVAVDYVDLSALSFGGWQPSQDHGIATVTDNVLALTGNAWKSVALADLGVTNTFDWANGALTFEIKSTGLSEIQGIMLDNNLTQNNAVDSTNMFQVFGSQNWGSGAFTSENISDGWLRIEVDLSTVNTTDGVPNNIVFVNDDDSGPIGSVEFRNVSISDNVIDIDNSTDTLLDGTAGDDALVGLAGDDLLIGGGGSDILTGGDGNDIFIWDASDVGTSAAPAHDEITDFNTSNDVLNLADLLSDGSHTIEGIETGSGDLQLNIKDSAGDVVQEIELHGVSVATTATQLLDDLLISGAINDGI
jgi:hypothetical protein